MAFEWGGNFYSICILRRGVGDRQDSYEWFCALILVNNKNDSAGAVFHIFFAASRSFMLP